MCWSHWAVVLCPLVVSPTLQATMKALRFRAVPVILRLRLLAIRRSGSAVHG